MKFVYYENDDEFFKQGDYQLFEEVVGSTIDVLKDKIKVLSEAEIRQIYSCDKFVYSELNKFGLHVYRILLSHRIRNKKTPSTMLAQQFREQGYIRIDDYFSDKEFNDIYDKFQLVKSKFPEGKFVNLETSAFFAKHQILLNLLLDCAGVNRFMNGVKNNFLMGEFWYHKHFKDDPQCRFHSDTFQPTLKSFIYLEDVTDAEGPFTFVPYSSIIDKKRMIWDYENSLMSEEGANHKLWQKRIQANGKPGSFRVCENSSLKEEQREVKNLGYGQIKSFTAPKNTMIIVNTFGFHKRGIGKEGNFRSSMSLNYRPQAFGLY